MTYSGFRKFIGMMILMLIQVLVCNNIHLFGYATPLLIGYVVLSAEKGTDRISLLLWGFFTGLIYDMFSNTAGMASASLTLLAMLQPSLLASLTSRESDEKMAPNVDTMRFGNFLTYTILCMFIIHSVFFMLDAFMLANIRLTLLSTISSTLLATVLVLFIDYFTKPTIKNDF